MTTANLGDEYAIRAEIFKQTLQSQRATRLKGGLYHLTQILLAYNTNRIEGSKLDIDQTRYLYETRTISGENIPVDDVIETINSFELFDTMIDRLEQPITADTLKDYHRILKTGTRAVGTPYFMLGDWKNIANVIGSGKIETSAPEAVDRDIHALLQRTPTAMTFEDIVQFHHDFERIHPFSDGNGRVGRIVMFQQCLQNDIMPFVVLDEQKAYYYRGLDRYEEQPGFLRDTLRAMQDRYYQTFERFVTPALTNQHPAQRDIHAPHTATSPPTLN